jgi:hypothetical protein
MRSKFRVVLLVAIGFNLTSYALADNVKGVESSDGKYLASSLCDAGGIVFFSCGTRNNKVISLCGRGSPTEPTGVFYRFGKQEKIEMDFPKDKNENSFSFLSYDNYFRYRVNLLNVYFENNGYSYILYNDYREDDPEVGDQRESGVSVTKIASGELVANIKCKSEIITNFDFLLKKIECKKDGFCQRN